MTQVSGSSFADALIATMVTQSASIFDSASMTGNVTKNDLGLLDTSHSGCVFLILPPAWDLDSHTYGGKEFMKYRIIVRAFVKDTGNSVDTMNKLFGLDQVLRAVTLADDTLGGSAMHSHFTHGGGWDGYAWIGTETGNAWAPQDFTLEVESVG